MSTQRLIGDDWDIHMDTFEHRDGTPWWEASAPKKRHKHSWQTRAWAGSTRRGEELLGYWVYRCACGATLYSDYGVWIEERTPRRARAGSLWARRFRR